MHYILDLECDNLLDKVTKIHCIVLKDINTNEFTTDLDKVIEKMEPDQIDNEIQAKIAKIYDAVYKGGT